MDKAVIDSLIVRFSDLGLKVLGALAVWIIGRWLIKVGLNVIAARMERRKFDHTIVVYTRNTASVLLNIALVVVIMGVLGIETTSFAAFIAGAGLAIGAAWSGLLSNFAAGAFLVILRPFKVGDQISGGGVTGTVEEIGLFVTTILTPDNVRTFVGNSRLFTGNLKNYSANPARRVEMSGTISHTANLDHTIAAIRERLLTVPNVLADPAPEIAVLAFSQHCLSLALRPYAHTDHYWQVHFDSTNALRGLLDSVGPHAGHGGDDVEGGEGIEGAEAEAEGEGEEEAAGSEAAAHEASEQGEAKEAAEAE